MLRRCGLTTDQVLRVLPLLGLALLAATLLLNDLGKKYLWQDEANTAVLAVRFMSSGLPLAWDGVNFIGLDDFSMELTAPIDELTRDPGSAVTFYARRGDVRVDHSWKNHPLGQFLIAGVSMAVLGKTTWAARIPFALAGLLTVFLFYRLTLSCFADRVVALSATTMFVLNSYWILHARQCRYYPLSTLFLIATLIAYLRWQRGARFGPVAFVVVAHGWFQVDFGTFWPLMAVLAIDALITRRQTIRMVVGTGLTLLLSLVPFIWYYELWHRRGTPTDIWQNRFLANLFNLNEYVAPGFVVVAALVLLTVRWRSFARNERHIVLLSGGILLAMAVWIPLVAPQAFLRYSIIVAPMGSLLAAWLFARISPHRVVLLAATTVLVVTPWLSMPFRWLIPPDQTTQNSGGYFYRPELVRLLDEVFGHPYDINREVVDWLRQNTSPTDEILVNYEDAPLMFYLPNPIRGGIAAFRVEDDRVSPPEFLVLRPWVSFVHWPVFLREIQKYQWVQEPLGLAPAMWGNNPDPMGAMTLPTDQTVLVARRRH